MAEFGRGVMTGILANPSRIWYEIWIPLHFSLACQGVPEQVQTRHGERALVPPVTAFVQCALVGENLPRYVYVVEM